MNFLLAGINARYNHTNLAIRSITSYIKKYSDSDNKISFAEWTINQNINDILKGIYALKPDLIIFSTYIWNAEIVSKIISELKKILPHIIIAAGGPEVSYASEKYLTKLSDLDFIIRGEGEETVLELFNTIKSLKDLQDNIEKISGVSYKTKDNNIFYTSERKLISNLDDIPFPYEEITEPDNKIYYYESSRGCPFSCAYCLSSVDKKVRFSSLEKVFSDLKIFIDKNVKLVKFVDRTYNLNEERYLAIWKFILDNHNGKTMFHFEIEAEYLSENVLNFLLTVPKNIMQFEIGVQSSNKKTLRAVDRSENIEVLAENIKRIPKTIHKHLDLIAGLPYETLEEFSKSFNYVMNLFPDALQLGFLKVLHGTKMEEIAKAGGWKWQDFPMYEFYSTPYLSFEDVLILKDLEHLVDVFYNSHHFENIISFVSRHISWWDFFYSILLYARNNNAFDAERKEIFWFNFLFSWNETQSFFDKNIFYQLLKYDFVLTGKKGSFPDWYNHIYNKEKHLNMLENDEKNNNLRLGFAYTEYEVFSINVLAECPENEQYETEVLIKYK